MVANRAVARWPRAGNGILTRMAKDQFSFDIVSEVDLQEVRNAVDQAQREISQRFDFKDTETGISQDHTTIELRSSTEDRLKAALQVLKEKIVKRNVPLKASPRARSTPPPRATCAKPSRS